MHAVDVVDETFLAVPPSAIARALADPAAWRRFWPDLRLQLYADRGPKGLRWTVRGALVGTMEVWLEPVLDGTVLHYFLRADFASRGDRPAGIAAKDVVREGQRRQLAAKQTAFTLKVALEAGREPGCPPPA
jgi:hypothetical protein